METFSAGKRHVLYIIHDIITALDPFPYTAKFMLLCDRNDKTQQIRC